jgi:choline dehydrogenase-like flavoprotein
MIVDAKTVPKDSHLECDICIIGGGPAGISIAKEFIGSSTSVILLESGGETSDEDNQALANGGFSLRGWGHQFENKDCLNQCRGRLLGGTSDRWGGMCGEFDAQDYEKRDWIPHSGWPINDNDVRPYLPNAAKLCGITPIQEDLSKYKGTPLVVGDGNKITSKIFHFSPPVRFGQQYKNDLDAARNLRTFLNANVTDLIQKEDKQEIDYVDVKTLSGNSFEVKSKIFVLATGGIDNAKLLLNANNGRGIGNENDLVGRFFMGHIYIIPIVPSIVFSSLNQDNFTFYTDHLEDELGHNVSGCFALHPEEQQNLRISNANLLFGALGRRTTKAKGGRKLEEDLDAFGKAAFATAKEEFRNLTGRSNTAIKDENVFEIAISVEQAPNPNSRVLLSDTRDSFGNPLANLDARFQEIDYDTILGTVQTFAKELGVNQVAKARILAGRKTYFDNQLHNLGCHHMGTTRMSDSPRTGVVDKNCKVFGVSNLYIAGSSVFSTGGAVNPTYKIVALGLRLADHIKKV